MFRDYERAWLVPDVLAGLTLAAVAIPECMGYTKIVGTPVVTGLYTILIPLAAFALLGSSRHLVVGADSATAAILYAGLTGMAMPLSSHWLALTSAAALVTAACLLLSSLLRLGFLADFLSRTVLVGFLSGVGVSLLVGQIPDMLGIPAHGSGPRAAMAALAAHGAHPHLPTLITAVSIIALILVMDRFSTRVPAALTAVVLAIATVWLFRLDQYGVALVGPVQAGLPRLQLPAVTSREAVALLPTCASMFLVIVAQSAATARSFAQKHSEALDENRDLLALAAANAFAGVSRTFVVNGSPTKTAVVDDAGSRSQVAQLTTAVIVAGVLLVASPLIERLPVTALAALVSLVGLKLIDLAALRAIYRFRTSTFLVALTTLAVVVWFGVERGMFVAIALSVIDHLRQEYHPKDVVLVASGSHWTRARADLGSETDPGLIIYRFEAPLFFANADYFSARVRHMVAHAPHQVRWLVLDLVSLGDIDFTGGVTLTKTVRQLQQQRIEVALAGAEDLAGDLERLGIFQLIARDRVFESVQRALEAYRVYRSH